MLRGIQLYVGVDDGTTNGSLLPHLNCNQAFQWYTYNSLIIGNLASSVTSTNFIAIIFQFQLGINATIAFQPALKHSKLFVSGQIITSGEINYRSRCHWLSEQDKMKQSKQMIIVNDGINE